MIFNIQVSYIQCSNLCLQVYSSIFKITHSIFKFVYSRFKFTVQNSSLEFNIQVYNSTLKFGIQYSRLLNRSSLSRVGDKF